MKLEPQGGKNKTETKSKIVETKMFGGRTNDTQIIFNKYIQGANKSLQIPPRYPFKKREKTRVFSSDHKLAKQLQQLPIAAANTPHSFLFIPSPPFGCR